jgi:DNA-binding XRE family transcriptional regulator
VSKIAGTEWYIKTLRLREQMTQVALAKKIGVTPPLVYACENGLRRWPSRLFVKLAKVFHTDPYTLVDYRVSDFNSSLRVEIKRTVRKKRKKK